MLIDFRQFLYDSVVKVLFKAYISSFFFFFFFLHDRNAKAHISTQSEYTVYIICSHTQCHSAMHNNLNILEIKTSFRTAALYSKCQPAKYFTDKQFKPSVKR